MIGLALCLSWVFCAFPTVDANAGLQQSQQDFLQILLRLAIVGVVPGLLIPLLSDRLAGARTRTAVAAFCCLFRLLGTGLGMAVSGDPGLFAVLFLGDFLIGTSTAFLLVFWGVSFCSCDTESQEKAFRLVIGLCGVAVIAAYSLPVPVLPVVLFAFPVAEFACFATMNRGFDKSHDCALPEGRSQSSGAASRLGESGRELCLLVARTCLAITLVSFTWEIVAHESFDIPFSPVVLFGVGFILSSAVIWMFTKYSSSVGFVAAARWILPIMSLGLFFSSFDQGVSLVLACLLLACAHASFEMILRMQVIGFARKSGRSPYRIVGWGFVSIMLGAFLGPLAYGLIADVLHVEGAVVIVGVLTTLVVVSAFLFFEQRPEGGSVSGPSCDAGERSSKMAVGYGLTKREQEVLSYLLEGRSHPYIRDTLYISKSTVDTHVRHIYAKTGVKSKQELIDLSKR